MFVIIWQFDVDPEHVTTFEQAYGPEGTWAAFFRRSPGYLGTRLFRDTGRPDRYLTLDRWASEEDFRRFEQEHAAEYQRIDASFEAITAREQYLGSLHVE